MVEYFGFRPSLARVRDVVILLVVGGAFATIISAGIGGTALWLAGDFATGEVISFMLRFRAWRGRASGWERAAPSSCRFRPSPLPQRRLRRAWDRSSRPTLTSA
jgi:hypothetical protein